MCMYMNVYMYVVVSCECMTGFCSVHSLLNILLRVLEEDICPTCHTVELNSKPQGYDISF